MAGSAEVLLPAPGTQGGTGTVSLEMRRRWRVLGQVMMPAKETRTFTVT